MAQFRGILSGTRGEASRLGNRTSGMEVQCNGWDAGVRVVASDKDGKDVFNIWTTGGSHNASAPVLLGTLEDGVFYRPVSPDCSELCDSHCPGGES